MALTKRTRIRGDHPAVAVGSRTSVQHPRLGPRPTCSPHQKSSPRRWSPPSTVQRVITSSQNEDVREGCRETYTHASSVAPFSQVILYVIFSPWFLKGPIITWEDFHETPELLASERQNASRMRNSSDCLYSQISPGSQIELIKVSRMERVWQPYNRDHLGTPLLLPSRI